MATLLSLGACGDSNNSGLVDASALDAASLDGALPDANMPDANPGPTSSISVDPNPDALNAPWTLTGPDSYSYQGSGDEIVEALALGTYSITWSAIGGATSPAPATAELVLTEDASGLFIGNYDQKAGEQALRLTNTDATTTAYLRIPDDDTLEPAALTLEAWITPRGVGFGGATNGVGTAIVSKPIEGATGTGLASWGLHWSSATSTVSFFVVRSSSELVVISAPADSVPVDTLAHVAATFDGSVLTLYVDGVQQATAAYPFVGIQYGADDVLIGASNLGSGFVRRYDGKVDEVRIWNYARTQSEIELSRYFILDGTETGLLGYWNFEAGTFDDLGPNSHHATLEEVGTASEFVTADLPSL